MDPFSLKQLGRTAVHLPRLGFGGAGLGHVFAEIDDDEAAETVRAAWDAGVRYYDTSPWHGRGLCEHRVGRELYRKPREDVIVSTKVGRIFRAPRIAKLSPAAGGRGRRDSSSSITSTTATVAYAQL